MLDAAHYYWRIKAKRQRDILLSEMGHFSLSEDTGSIHPLLQKLSKGSGPKGFTLEVARDVQFNTVVSTQVSNSPKCSDQGLTAGTYYCRVLGIGASKMNKTYVFVVK